MSNTKKTKMFHVCNSREEGIFVLAKSKDDAIDICKIVGHIRKRTDNVVEQTHLTNSESVQELLNAGKRGIVVCKIQAVGFFEILQGVTLNKPEWTLVYEVS